MGRWIPALPSLMPAQQRLRDEESFPQRYLSLWHNILAAEACNFRPSAERGGVPGHKNKANVVLECLWRTCNEDEGGLISNQGIS